ncbi:MAG: hypothetical protein ACRC4W_00105 [Treponemataceae bacterium]
MDIKEYINLCCVKKKISNAAVARKTNQSTANFNQKMSRNSFKTKELEIIADAFDSYLEIKFIDKSTNTPII